MLDRPVHRLEAPSQKTRQPAVFLLPTHSVTHAHILRMHDILWHLVSLPPSYPTSVRTLRAWRALAKCKEFDVAALWRLGAQVVERTRGFEHEGLEYQKARKADWIKRCQESKLDQVEKFQEYLLSLVAAGRTPYALEEANSFLPSHPYHDSIALNTLAGFLSLFLSQPAPQDGTGETVLASEREQRASRRSVSVSRPASRDESRSDLEEEGGSDSDEQFPQRRRKPSDVLREEAILALCSTHAPDLYSEAKEHFRRAARLEDENPGRGRSEGRRWLTLLESASDRSKRYPRH